MSKRKATGAPAEESETKLLKEEVAKLKSQIEMMSKTYYASKEAVVEISESLPEHARPAFHVLEEIREAESLDFKPRLNTSSYVNVVFEPEEQEAPRQRSLASRSISQTRRCILKASKCIMMF